MKNQDLFSSKDKSKKLKCCLLQFLFGTLRVNQGTKQFENQDLVSSKDKSKKLICCLLQFLLGALRVNQGNKQLV